MGRNLRPLEAKEGSHRQWEAAIVALMKTKATPTLGSFIHSGLPVGIDLITMMRRPGILIVLLVARLTVCHKHASMHPFEASRLAFGTSLSL